MTTNNPSDTGREMVKKKEWTSDQWKNGNDIERLVWFISTLSPHNLWKAEEAIAQALASKGEEVIKLKRENDLLVGYRDLLIELHPDKESTLTPTDKGKEVV